MQIKEITIGSFGKFQKKNIHFTDGVNLIIGNNEAGKTTIHQFIQGMFYGFYKPNLKTKKSSFLNQRFLPWDNNLEYYGSMTIEDNHSQYKVERSFLKDAENVSVFDNLTGTNVDDYYDYDEVTKQILVGDKHLLMNQVAYENTVSISQMNSATSEELLKEVKENLLNISQAKSLNISINDAMTKIGEKRRKIGTKRSKKLPYGQLIETINRLEEEKDSIGNSLADLNQLHTDEKALTLKIDKLSDSKHDVEFKMEKVKLKEKSDQYKQGKAIQTEVDKLNQEIDQVKVYENVEKDEVNKALEAYKDIEILNNKIEQIEGIIENMEGDIEEITEKIELVEEEGLIYINEEDLKSMIDDIYQYEGIEGSKSYIEQGFSEEDLEEKKDYLEGRYKKNKHFVNLSIISTVITVLLGAMIIVQRWPMNQIFTVDFLNQLRDTLLSSIGTGLVYIGVVALFITLVLIIIVVITSTEIKGVKREIDEVISNKNIVNMRLSDANNKQIEILKRYDVTTYEDLKEKYDQLSKELHGKTNNDQLKEQYNKEIKDLQERIKKEFEVVEKGIEEKEQLTRLISSINEKYGINSKNGLDEALTLCYTYKQLVQQRDDKNNLLYQITKGVSLEDMAKESVTEENAIRESYEELEQQLKEINDAMIDVNKEHSRLMADLTAVEDGYNQVVLIEEEIAATNKQKDAEEFNLETLALIENTIESISEKIQSGFAPKLNKELSKIISIATDYRYTDIKVSNDMEVSVIDNDTNRMVSINTLSAGTIDLMYFALRIALADIITKDKKVPLLLDDAFVQYDDMRFKNVVNVLNKLERQIIIFTCHKREKKISNRVLDDVNIIRI